MLMLMAFERQPWEVRLPSFWGPTSSEDGASVASVGWRRLLFDVIRVDSSLELKVEEEEEEEVRPNVVKVEFSRSSAVWGVVAVAAELEDADLERIDCDDRVFVRDFARLRVPT
ncbi:hypothetical protein ZHAS_00022353 [Anopheles sinensis]|uniref:Uncharacterized protein n=1 Tax=Anopheles sinensis TaxID=74873 RepID=A0A084WUL2_ANOSI|nr:hypothetical protein ZHAS_00022353 [Anopheles sinensis]